MRAVNKFNNKVYFISVANVRRRINVPMSLNMDEDEIALPPLELEIRLQAAVYEYKSNFLRQIFSKPVLVVNLDDVRGQVTNEEFSELVQEVIESEPVTDLLKKNGVSGVYDRYGFRSVGKGVWSLFHLSKVKHTFILKTPKDEHPIPPPPRW
jgi:hypothetical protein